MSLRTSINDYQQLSRDRSDALIFRCIAGSRAYGTAGPASDVDLRGLYVLPAWQYLALHEPIEQVADASNNEVYYAVRRFLGLAAQANPTMLELLFMPADCVQIQTPCMDLLLAKRGMFITKRAYESHVAFAHAQVRRARGQNKWVNNPKPEAKPSKESFCWVIPREWSEGAAGDRPFRPIPLAESGISLKECHAASLEHVVGAYRLYHYGPDARGVFRGGNLVCESIPLVDESSRCVGLLIFNATAYERAMKDHENYWTWRRSRNEARWVTQERGETDYDAKNLMHTFRLLLSAEHLFLEGMPRVRFTGESLRLLLDIRAGCYSYEQLIGMAEEKVAHLEALTAESSLPEKPDEDSIEALLMEITATWEAEYAG